MDSTRKKVDFLQMCIDKLQIPNARAVWARAEDHLAEEKVDIVMARAVSSVRENVRTGTYVRECVSGSACAGTCARKHVWGHVYRHM